MSPIQRGSQLLYFYCKYTDLSSILRVTKYFKSTPTFIIIATIAIYDISTYLFLKQYIRKNNIYTGFY